MKAKIHIGSPKSGTTTLQDFLFRNRAALERQGFLYRRYGSQGNHPELAVATFHRLGELLGDSVVRAAMGIRDLEGQARLANAFDAEVIRDTACEGIHTMLLSCELLGAPGRGARFIDGFRGWSEERFREIEIILYIRRQDRYAESCYSQYLRGGGSKSLEQYLADFQPPNYNRMVRLWENSFGRENVTVRRLQKRDLVGGDLVEDFCATVGADANGLIRPRTLNASFSSRQAEWLRRANAQLPDFLRHGNVDRAARWVLRMSVSSLVSNGGPGVRMSDEVRQSLLEGVAGANEQLRIRRFPDSEALFDD